MASQCIEPAQINNRDERLRQHCLSLAIEDCKNGGGNRISIAREYFDFIKGARKDPAGSPPDEPHCTHDPQAIPRPNAFEACVEPGAPLPDEPFWGKALKRLRERGAQIVEVDHAAKYILTSKRHVYTIVLRPGYMGCTMSNRESLSGETWLRGSDLADGKPTEETWARIMGDILAYELI